MTPEGVGAEEPGAPGRALSDRVRWSIAVGAAVVLLGGSAAYGVGAWQRFEQRSAAAPPIAVATGEPVAGDRVVFRNTALGDGYGLVASVPLADPGGARSLTDRACDRVAATATTQLCLRTDRGVLTSFEAVLTDADGAVLRSWPLPGIPSRARLGDGVLATTAFVSGHSYAPTTFSTQTVLRSLEEGVADPGDLESFALTVAGSPLTAVDRNLWGVTFADDGDTFYATAASGDRTWLVRGSLAARTLEAVQDTAECPSISPDGRRIAYKKDAGGAVPDWRIAVLDLASGVETVLEEDRSVDDQVLWLDDGTLLYGLPREGVAGDTDVWSIAADGRGAPELFLEHAWSPSVVRSPTP